MFKGCRFDHVGHFEDENQLLVRPLPSIIVGTEISLFQVQVAERANFAAPQCGRRSVRPCLNASELHAHLVRGSLGVDRVDGEHTGEWANTFLVPGDRDLLADGTPNRRPRTTVSSPMRSALICVG